MEIILRMSTYRFVGVCFLGKVTAEFQYIPLKCERFCGGLEPFFFTLECLSSLQLSFLLICLILGRFKCRLEGLGLIFDGLTDSCRQLH